MMTNINHVNGCLLLSCFIGLALSYYAYVIEMAKEQDESYTAMCDISEHMSCSKVLTSEFSKGFGLVKHYFGEDSVLNQPNCLAGMVFYTILASLCAVNSKKVAKAQVILCIMSNLTSVYLGYILYFVLYDLCLVCVSTYAVNLATLHFSVLKLRLLASSTSPDSMKVKSN